MFLILRFIDKKIFVYSEKEIKSNVGKENETSKTNTVSVYSNSYFKFMIKKKIGKADMNILKIILLKMLYSNILPFIHINNSEKLKKEPRLMDKLIDRWIIFF